MAPRKKKDDENPGMGHNGGPDSVAAAELRQFIERVERLQEEKQSVQDDINDVFGEAKGRGYDVKAMKAIIKERKQDREERMEHEAIVDTYRAALGMLPGGGYYETSDESEAEADAPDESDGDDNESMV